MSAETLAPESAAPQAQKASRPLERTLTLRVDKTEIDKEVKARLREIGKGVRIPGFRPGKAPMAIIAQQYGAQAHSEALSEAVHRAFVRSAQEQKLRVAGYPSVTAEAGDDSHYAFAATFELLPEVVVGALAQQAITRRTLELAESDIDSTLGRLRKQRVTYVPATRPAAAGDRLLIDFTGRLDGEEFEGGSAKDYMLIAGTGSMIEDFDAALIGMAADEKKVFDARFPQTYPVASLAGKTVQFEVLVKAVEAEQLPEVDAAFASALGIKDGDVAKLRAEVRENLQREVKKRLQARITKQVMDALIAVSPFDVPQTLVQAESAELAANMRKNLEQRGMPAARAENEVRPELFNEAAERRVRLGLILAELTAQEKLSARPEQVRTMIEEYAATFEDPSEVLRWYYDQPERLQEAQALVTENNVVDWVLERAQVTENPISLQELLEENQA